MGGIKKKLQRLFGGGGGNKKRREGNLSEIGRTEGLGGIGLTGLGMTQSGTDLGDWGNGAILDELKPTVPSRKDRPQLTTARRDNLVGGGLQDDLSESSLESSGETSYSESSLESSGETSYSESSLESSGETSYSESSLESSGDTELSESSLESSGETELSESSLESSGDTELSESSLESSGDTLRSESSLESSGYGGYGGYNSREDDDDDLSGLPTLGLVSQQDKVPEPPPVPPPPPKGSKYGSVAPLKPQYKGEDVNAKWRDQRLNKTGGITTTDYLQSEEERSKRRIEVDDQGRLVRNGELVTTGNKNEKGEVETTTDLFAMSPEGDLLGSNGNLEQERLDKEMRVKMDESAREFGKNTWEDLTDEERAKIIEAGGGAKAFFHHSSFFGGGDLGGAGMFKSKEGLLKEIDPDSGHHRPTTEHTMQTLSELKERGTNLDHTRVGVHKRDEKGEVLANPNNPRDTQKEFFHSGEMFESGGDEGYLMGKKGFVRQLQEIHRKKRLDNDLSTSLESKLQKGKMTEEEVRTLVEGEDNRGIEDLDVWDEVVKGNDDKPVLDKDGKPQTKKKAFVDIFKDVVDPKKFLTQARKRKKNEKKFPESPKVEPKVSEFARRGEIGSDPKGQKKYDDLIELHHDYEGEHENAKWRGGGSRTVERSVGRDETEQDHQHMRTVALTDEGRDKRRIQVGEDGLLYDSTGLLMDTSETMGLIREDMERAFLFGMDETGDILSTDAYEEAFKLRLMRDDLKAREKRGEKVRDTGEGDYNFFNHSSFFGGRKLAAAGELSVREGKAKLLTPNSGHHRGGNENMLNVMEELTERGLDTSDLRVDMKSNTKAQRGERQTGGAKMQYLSGGLIQQAMGTEDDKGVTREKTLDRLGTHMDMLDQIKQIRVMAGRTKETRLLEDEIAKAMLDGAGYAQIEKYVESFGYELVESTGSSVVIVDPNAITPNTMRKFSTKNFSSKEEKEEVEGIKKGDEERHLKQSETSRARSRERMDGLRDGKKDRLNLPEWALTQKELDRRSGKETKKKKKAPSLELPFNDLGYSLNKDDQVQNDVPYSFNTEPKDDDQVQNGVPSNTEVKEEPPPVKEVDPRLSGFSWNKPKAPPQEKVEVNPYEKNNPYSQNTVQEEVKEEPPPVKEVDPRLSVFSWHRPKAPPPEKVEVNPYEKQNNPYEKQNNPYEKQNNPYEKQNNPYSQNTVQEELKEEVKEEPPPVKEVDPRLSVFSWNRPKAPPPEKLEVNPYEKQNNPYEKQNNPYGTSNVPWWMRDDDDESKK